MDNYKFGKWCEERAAEYLQGKGWRLLVRRAYFRCGEIDLIMVCDSGLCFVEVKGRRSDKFGAVVESLTAQKMRRLKKAVSAWRAREQDYRPGQIYFVGVEVSGGEVSIVEHCIY